jgi:hypothetical protein
MSKFILLFSLETLSFVRASKQAAATSMLVEINKDGEVMSQHIYIYHDFWFGCR